jgi:nucleotide-binding universal stress UspA family protein
MIPEIKKILYATDLSDNAIHAFGYASSIANQYGGKITILHVLEELPPSAGLRMAAILGKDKWDEILKEDEQQVLDTIRTRLEKFCNERGSEFPDCPLVVDDIIVKQGNAVQEILKQSEAGKYDMVVMGTHGHGILGNALMGSTARRVVRRSDKPVLVIRLPD